jgi:hypothetical protein
VGEGDAADRAEAPRRRRGEGTLELDFPRGRATRLALAGALIGYPGFGVWVALLAGTLLGDASDAITVAAVALLLVVALAVCIALPPWLQRLRQPRAAVMEWDRSGIVERDGAHVRTAILWDDASARIDTTPKGRLVQITDPDGRAITVAERRAAPRWLARRKASADDLGALVSALVNRPPGPEIAPDPRDARRPTMRPTVAVATVVVGLASIPLFASFPGLRVVVPAFAALLACILCALPTLRPVHEMLDLLAAGRRFDRAEEATIEEGEGASALLRRAKGGLVRVDLSRAAHPDVQLATRAEATVWVVLPHAGWVPATSRVDVGPPVEVEAIETAHERAVRGELVRAVAIELCARGAAVGFWGAASLAPVLR